ncbi:MAG: replication-relaxation family protein [Solirubrobacteraceae bacterium]
MLASLAELRFLTARQIERWHYQGATPLARARAARRGLERLTSLGVLTRLERRIGGVRAGSAGYVYALDLSGQRVAARYGWLHVGRTRRLREPGRTFLRHSLAVAEVHVRLIEADRAGTLELIERQSEPTCWRSFAGPGGGRLILKPDAFAVVATPTLELSWFVEVDQDTESATTIERKLAAHVAYWRSGREVATQGVQPRTLWLAPNARRVGQLERAVGRLPLEARPLFAVAAFDRVIEALSGDD